MGFARLGDLGALTVLDHHLGGLISFRIVADAFDVVSSTIPAILWRWNVAADVAVVVFNLRRAVVEPGDL